ncbi:hypothetical protein F511_35373 [Dorcoceras hygrometricum]|uniref:Uncharacterized protein n=1 Tax=Dorcoceras hygrometricum TaxID=472368 RepID=A0A2Z7AD91_9LAMI|nr:hypothetical protein F511_35373 [Dorcoceras hygrometricum]
MAPSVPRTRAAAALRMKQIALDNHDRTIRRLRAQLATERRGLATTKKELEDTQAVDALVMVAAGSRRAIVRVIEEATRVCFEEPVADEKQHRLVKWKRCVLGIASGTSSEGMGYNSQRGVYRIATLLASRRLAPTSFTRKPALQTVGGGRSSIRSTIGINLPPYICTRRSDGFCHGRNLLVAVIETSPITRQTDGGGAAVGGGRATFVTLNGSGIQLAVGPQPLRFRNHNFGLTNRIMVKRLATSPHDPLGITDSACKNQFVVVSVQYGPFYTYISIRSTTIGKSRVAIDPIAMHTSWRSNSDIASVTRWLFVLRLDLVFVFLLLCCLGLCYPFAESSGNAGPSGVLAGRSPFS